MQFLLLMYIDRRMSPPADELDRYEALRQAMRDAGVYIANGDLQGPSESIVVRATSREVLRSSGGVNRTSESPVGFYLLDCATSEDAAAWAARVPAASHGCVEVRPLQHVAVHAARS